MALDLQSRNLTISRGVAFFAPYLTGTQTPGPYRDLGNCPEFTMSRAVTTLEHRSSRGGMTHRDAMETLNSDINVTVTMEDLNAKNMAFWFLDTPQTTTIASATDATETLSNVQPGGIYQLGRSNSAPMGLRGISSLQVVRGSDTLTADTDYILDGDTGLLTITEDGDVALDDDLALTYDVAASSFSLMTAANAMLEGEMKFVSQNPFGPNRIIMVPRVKISPVGDLALLSESESPTWSSLQINMMVLKKGNMALAYNADGLPALGTASV